MFNNFPGNSERKLVSTYEGYHGATARQLMTQIPVVENTCSIKPRIFGHFQKVHEEFTNAMTTTQWVLFKVCSKKSCCSVELAVLKHYYYFFYTKSDRVRLSVFQHRARSWFNVTSKFVMINVTL